MDKAGYQGPTKKGINVPLERASSVIDIAKEVLEKGFDRMNEHVKEVQERKMKKDLSELKRKYGSRT